MSTWRDRITLVDEVPGYWSASRPWTPTGRASAEAALDLLDPILGLSLLPQPVVIGWTGSGGNWSAQSTETAVTIRDDTGTVQERHGWEQSMAHELVHVIDKQMMNDADRALVMATLTSPPDPMWFKIPVHRNWLEGDVPYMSNAGEAFAEGYSRHWWFVEHEGMADADLDAWGMYTYDVPVFLAACRTAVGAALTRRHPVPVPAPVPVPVPAPVTPTGGIMPLILDYSFARPDPKAMRVNYAGAMRYLSSGVVSPAQTNPKDLTKDEVNKLFAAGLSIGLVWETTAQRALGGRGAGVADANAAEAQATALGFPSNCPIFYGVDFGASSAQMATVLAYFGGVRSVAHRPVGVYGSFNVVEAVHAAGVPYVWQTSAWSNVLINGKWVAQVSTKAHLYQRLYATKPKISGTDENIMLIPLPMWTVGMPIKPPVPVNPGPVRPPITPVPSGRNIPMVKAIQAAVHVVVDGAWGDATSKAATAVIRKTMTDVRFLQACVGTTVDGAWGPKSEMAWLRAIESIQHAIGVAADGQWGPISQAAWVKAYNANFKKF